MRSAFDKLISFTGLALAAVLLAAGGLLVWANSFIGNQVHDQLVMQDITMPGGDAIADLPRPTRRRSSRTPAADARHRRPRPRPTPTTTSSCT